VSDTIFFAPCPRGLAPALADELTTLEEIGELTNLTRERVRQVEVRGLIRLRARSNALR
jgi:DNA-directed RNA polymerase sigma subunit (sigma70/sigma32)